MDSYIFEQRPDLFIKVITSKEVEEIKEAEERKLRKLQKNPDALLKDTQDACIDEARTCIEAARVNNMSVLDEEYENIVKNTESWCKSAKIISDIRGNKSSSKGAIIGGISKLIAVVGEFAMDFIFKHPIVPMVKAFFKGLIR